MEASAKQTRMENAPRARPRRRARGALLRPRADDPLSRDCAKTAARGARLKPYCQTRMAKVPRNQQYLRLAKQGL
jgi:hypothetical protein